MSKLEKKSEISLKNANDQIDELRQKIQSVKIMPPAKLGYVSCVALNTLSILSLGSSLTAIVLVFLRVFPVWSPCIPATLAGLALATMLPLDNWDGNPRNRIRTFFAKYVFTSRKKRLELNARQQEWKEYHEAMEIFRLYVKDLYIENNVSELLNTINKHNTEKELYMDINGEFSYRHISQKTNEKNAEKITVMMQELNNSPRIKEQLLGELNK